MVIAVITGANQGLGFETCRQLALTTKVHKIILTCRSEEKAKSAITALAKATGVYEATFGFILFDLLDHASVKSAMKMMPAKIDLLLLNAGGLGGSDYASLTENNVTKMFGNNTLGHAILLEGLLASGKISTGARVVFSGSETTRTVLAMVGMNPRASLNRDEMKMYPSKPPMSFMAMRSQMAAYSNAKLIGMLWISKLAEEHPNIYFATVSPGGSNTNVYKEFAQPAKCLVKTCFPLFQALGVGHSPEEGAKRFVDALLVEAFPHKFPSGSVVGGPNWFGTAGTLAQQDKFSRLYTDKDLQTESAKVIRQLIAA